MEREGLRAGHLVALAGAAAVLVSRDVALAGGAGVVGLVLLTVAGAAGPGVRVDASAAARQAAFVGIALGAVVVLRLLSRPAPAEILALGPGGWVAMAGCALMGFGGLLAVGSPDRAAGTRPVLAGHAFGTPPAAAPVAAAETSVAPPPRA